MNTGHIYLAHIAVHTGISHFLKEDIGGFSVDGSEDAGMEGAVFDHILHQQTVNFLCVPGICKTGFLGEGVLVQPVRQKQVHGGTALQELGAWI